MFGIDGESVPGFAHLGLSAFTTTRSAGDFRLTGSAPSGVVFGRWTALLDVLAAAGATRLAMANQVHGDHVVVHSADWNGWLRVPAADGHCTTVRGTALSVTLADCVPVFIGHPSGAGALLHAGWRGTAGGILARAVAQCLSLGLAAGDLVVHLGPAICGRCYEVGPEVQLRLTGHAGSGAAPIDLRAILEQQAVAAGVRQVTASPSCTRCDNDRFFSHRGGDEGRHLGVLVTAR